MEIPLLPYPSIHIETLPWLRVPWDHPFPLSWGHQQIRPRHRYTYNGIDGEVVDLLTIHKENLHQAASYAHRVGGNIIGVDCPSVMKFLPFDVHDPVLDTLPDDVPKVVRDYYGRSIITRIIFGSSYAAIAEPRQAAEKAWDKYWKARLN